MWTAVIFVVGPTAACGVAWHIVNDDHKSQRTVDRAVLSVMAMVSLFMIYGLGVYLSQGAWVEAAVNGVLLVLSVWNAWHFRHRRRTLRREIEFWQLAERFFDDSA